MGLCPSCRGAKKLPLMGGMGTKECATCKGAGCVEGLLVTPFFPDSILEKQIEAECHKPMIVDIYEGQPDVDPPEIKLLQDEPITKEQIIERLEEPAKSKKAGRPPKNKGKWGF